MAKFKVLLTSVLLVSLFFHSLYLWSQIDNMAAGNGDFVIFYTGAQMLAAGRGSQLYDFATQKTFQDKFKVPIRDGPLPYNHPAYELLLFLPLTYFSFSTAHAIWSFSSAALLGLTLLLVTPHIHAEHRLLFSTMLIAFFPTVTAIMYGQDSILSAFLLVGVFAALKQNRHVAAGSILAFGLYKPQLVLPMACFLFYKRCWRATTSFILTGAVLAGISLVLVGWNGVQDFTFMLQLIDRLKYTIDPANMANLRGLLGSLFALSGLFESNAVVLLASALLLMWSLYRCSRDFHSSNHLFDLEFSLIAVVTLLTSYHLYAHDLTLLALPTILTLNSFFDERRSDGWRSQALQFIVLTFWFPLALLVLSEYRLLYFASIPIMLFAIVLAKEISCARVQSLVKKTEPAVS
jgi:hypothetical protein